MLLFTPVSITPLIDTEDACFDLNASRPIAKGDLKWRDALLVAHRVNSNTGIRKEWEADEKKNFEKDYCNWSEPLRSIFDYAFTGKCRSRDCCTGS